MKAPPVISVMGGLLAAGIGGWLFSLLGIPLAWILGAMAGSAIYTNLVGLSGKTKYVRRTGQLVVGTATATLLTMDLIDQLVDLLPAMVLAALAANLLGVVFAFPLQRIAGVDRKTAILSTMPAGMAEMASLSREIGARTEVVTVVHTLRVVMIVVLIPFLFGLQGSVAPVVADAGASYTALLACLVGGFALSIVATQFGMLNPWVVMPMACGIVSVALGFPLEVIPAPLVIAGQVFIGFSLGARLKKEDFRRVPRAVLASLLCGGGLIAAMVFLVAPVLRLWIDAPPVAIELGVAPGGIGEMIASAKALGTAAAFVAGFQFTRSFLTNLIAPPLILRIAGRSDPDRQ